MSERSNGKRKNKPEIVKRRSPLPHVCRTIVYDRTGISRKSLRITQYSNGSVDLCFRKEYEAPIRGMQSVVSLDAKDMKALRRALATLDMINIRQSHRKG